MVTVTRRMVFHLTALWVVCCCVGTANAQSLALRGRSPLALPATGYVNLGGDSWQSIFASPQTTCSIRPGDELWLVSTRQWCGAADCLDVNQLQIARYDACQWQDTNFDDLLARCQADQERQTIVYVHGNFTDLGWSLRRGCQVYQNLFVEDACQTCPIACPAPPLRFIIWSWNSEREVLPPKDFQVKVDRSWCEGVRLNQVLLAMSLKRPVVMGYSLGVQAILAAAAQQPAAAEFSAWRVALIAPVIHDCFPPYLCGTSELPIDWEQRLEKTVLFTNRRDRALKTSNRYFRIKNREPAFDQYDLAQALNCQLFDFSHCELSGETTGKHAIAQYTELPTVVTKVRELLLTSESPAAPTPAPADQATPAITPPAPEK